MLHVLDLHSQAIVPSVHLSCGVTDGPVPHCHTALQSCDNRIQKDQKRRQLRYTKQHNSMTAEAGG